jgi:hypothetical protein
MEIEDRVKKNISIFKENVKKAQALRLTGEEERVVELARMYADDTDAWMSKGDYVTAFSSIEYAHGLLDAILKINGADPYEAGK